MNKNLLITGATGDSDRRVVSLLKQKVAIENLAVLVREEKNELVKQYKHKGIAVKIGDYVNPASLLSAFQGIDVLYFVSVGDDDQRAQLHQNVVKAAQRAHVRHIIHTSSVWRNETDSPLWQR